jgi:putative FmdB family regulatory protein
MPTYEYVCTNCGHHVEVYQRFSEAPLTTCGVCGGPLRKVFHPAGIVFKGSGFYATDSRAKAGSKDGAGKGDGAKEPAKGSKDASAASSGSSDAKSEKGSAAPASKERSA